MNPGGCGHYLLQMEYLRLNIGLKLDHFLSDGQYLHRFAVVSSPKCGSEIGPSQQRLGTLLLGTPGSGIG